VSNRTERSNLALAALLLLALRPPGPLTAQVGHDPSRSPFRDITTRQGITLFSGYFSGNRAETGVGARPGPVFGARFQTRVSGPLDLSVTFAGITSTRYVIDPDSAPATRRSGPIDYNLVASDISLSLNLTGAKTWHGLAPYLSVGAGLIVPTEGRVDPGAYEAKNNFTLVPSIGARLTLSRSFAVSLEVRNYFVRYEWPLRYLYPTTNVDPVLDPNTEDDRDMTSNLLIGFGLSYRFNF
jgi:hypothetical protein